MMHEADDASTIRRGVAPGENGSDITSLLRSLLRHRTLIREMARRELTDMHAGQAAGFVWLILHPLLLFAVYACLFTFVFKVRVGDRGPSDYLVYLFSGLAPWLLTQDILSRAPLIMIANASIVKKVMFPTEALVAKTLLASLTVQLILFAAVVFYIVIARQSVPSTFLLFPLVFVFHLLLLWGLSLLLAAITPYFRDIPEFVRVFLTINIYLMPIMYLPDMAPDVLRLILNVNPFSALIWCYQDVLYFGDIAHPGAWLALSGLSVAVLVVGSYVFVRLRHHFASVL
jgi:lipopolysaccharide transport system permease protein